MITIQNAPVYRARLSWGPGYQPKVCKPKQYDKARAEGWRLKRAHPGATVTIQCGAGQHWVDQWLIELSGEAAPLEPDGEPVGGI